MKALALLLIFLSALSYPSFAQQDECDYKIELLINNTEFHRDDFSWKMRAIKVEGMPTNITGTAKIFQNGQIIKSYGPWNSEPISKQKTSSEYSPNLKPGSYDITAEINVKCNDINQYNNAGTKTITITEAIDGQQPIQTQISDVNEHETPQPIKTSAKTEEEATTKINTA